MKKTEKILIDTTFTLLYQRGYCATSLTDILDIIQLTKGAMYYHFKSKNVLVLASMKHYLDQILEDHWKVPLKESDKPLETLIAQINAYQALFENPKHFLDIKHGCPFGNFTLDMSDKDPSFFNYLQELYSQWQLTIEKALDKAQTLKQTQGAFNSADEALFIISSIEGAITTAKAYNDISTLKSGFKVLSNYIAKL
jgi:AcrR family transcriptional regulator